jgi:hypothetical protein
MDRPVLDLVEQVGLERRGFDVADGRGPWMSQFAVPGLPEGEEPAPLTRPSTEDDVRAQFQRICELSGYGPPPRRSTRPTATCVRARSCSRARFPNGAAG